MLLVPFPALPVQVEEPPIGGAVRGGTQEVRPARFDVWLHPHLALELHRAVRPLDARLEVFADLHRQLDPLVAAEAPGGHRGADDAQAEGALGLG